MNEDLPTINYSASINDDTRRPFTFFTSSWLSVNTSSAPRAFNLSFTSSDPALKQAEDGK